MEEQLQARLLLRTEEVNQHISHRARNRSGTASPPPAGPPLCGPLPASKQEGGF